MDGLSEWDADLTVYIFQPMANKVCHAFRRQLNSCLFTYDELFEGVILAYHVQMKGDKAKILPGLIAHFDIQTDERSCTGSFIPMKMLEQLHTKSLVSAFDRCAGG